MSHSEQVTAEGLERSLQAHSVVTYIPSTLIKMSVWLFSPFPPSEGGGGGWRWSSLARRLAEAVSSSPVTDTVLGGGGGGLKIQLTA